MMMSKLPPRPTPLATHGRQINPPEPCSPGEEGHLSKSLGFDSFLSIGLAPFHRQTSEVSSITHSGYLFKRSNRPCHQGVSPFPLDSLEITVATNGDVGDSAIQTEITPTLHPKPSPSRMDDEAFAISSHSSPYDNHHHINVPLHLAALEVPNATLASRFYHAKEEEKNADLPLAPLLKPEPEITESISTKGSIRDDKRESAKESMEMSQRKQALEQSLNSAAAFFGINLEAAFQEQPNDEYSDIMSNVSRSPPVINKLEFNNSMGKSSAPPPTRSVPIRMNNGSESSFGKHAVHRRVSAPCTYDNQSGTPEGDCTLSSNRSPPIDFTSKDGHIWRAKYCVLEDGILYFYRNVEDANTPDAQVERKTPFVEDNLVGSNESSPVVDLSKSPMVSRTCMVLPGTEGSLSGSSGDANSRFVWEKRVPLNCVGAVRSAERDYGKNAFELLAVDDDEGDGYTNKLVLKAPTSEDMNEWLFQFHRSLASFVRNMVDLVGATTPTYALGDIHHPGFDCLPILHSKQAPLKSLNVPAFSPRFVHNLQSPSVASLSHGHGRSQRRRRKPDHNSKGFSASSVHSVPETPSSHSPTRMPFPLTTIATSANLITPLKHGDLNFAKPESTSPLQQRIEMEDKSPELTASQSANPPETERPPPPPPQRGKYIPPHLRNKKAAAGQNEGSGKPPPAKYIPPHLRKKKNIGKDDFEKSNFPVPKSMPPAEAATRSEVDSRNDAAPQEGFREPVVDLPFKLGGCADPSVIAGSILDEIYVPRKASRVGRVPTDAFGSMGGGRHASSSLEWEIGAVSECGIRDSNEDAYFVTNDLMETFSGLIAGALSPTYWDGATGHKSGLFAIFDGHCGNQAARFAAERLPYFLYDEASNDDQTAGEVGPLMTEDIMRRAIMKLDAEFCRICIEGDREWESGSTALIAMLVEEHLVIASIGDCRGVFCRTFDEAGNMPTDGEWKESADNHHKLQGQKCYWREVADVHNPSREDERQRIERAGGWTTTEQEIPISQLQRMDFLDEDVIDILRRCFHDQTCSSAPQRILQISRVCGELAVSRAIGDRDFKAACNVPPSADVVNHEWESPLFLPFPDDHNRRFVGDLVSGKPDFKAMKVGGSNAQGEFLVLACDGLWDVMDMADAVRVTRDLLFVKNCPAKKAAARLAELAIHLGSSDNITVIVVRFFPSDCERR